MGRERRTYHSSKVGKTTVKSLYQETKGVKSKEGERNRQTLRSIYNNIARE